MLTKYQNLFSPAKINCLELKNRIIMPPMIFGFGNGYGMDTDKRIEVYKRRALGGAAMLIVGPYFSPRLENVDKNIITKFPAVYPYTDQNPRLYFMVEAVQANGGLICASLSPTPMLWLSEALKMRLENAPMDAWEQVVLNGLDVCNDLSTADIESNVEEFKEAARQIQQIGFDAIEINFSFLPDYFSLELLNKREDRYHYGDSPDQRYLYHKELLQGVRSVVGPDFPIMTMWDIDSFRNGWRTLDDSREMAKKFEEWGADSIRTRSGTSIDVEYDIVPQYLPRGNTAYLAKEIKKEVTIPVIANGKLSDPDLAERIIESGEADFISIGRGLIADPELPNKLRNGASDRLRKCIYCCVGCYGHSVQFPSRGSRCSVNPLFGNEEQFSLSIGRSPHKKKVVIVGGGPAGMSAAHTAATRGHDVILYESSNGIGRGGEFWLSTLPPFKQENLLIIDYYEREFTDFKNLQLHLNTVANADIVINVKPDVVIIATGGKPSIPNIPGVQGENVSTYQDVLLDRVTLGDHIVIIGGGQVGCETGHFLLEKGKRVTLLEMLPILAANVNRPTRNCLMRELTAGGVEMKSGARVVAISDQGLTYIQDGKEHSCTFDNIVLATGADSENRLYKEIRSVIPNVFIIGDAKKPRQIMHAVSEGFYSVYNL